MESTEYNRRIKLRDEMFRILDNSGPTEREQRDNAIQSEFAKRIVNIWMWLARNRRTTLVLCGEKRMELRKALTGLFKPLIKSTRCCNIDITFKEGEL